MVLAAPAADTPVVVVHQSPLDLSISPCELSMISMLLENHHLTAREAVLITTRPALLDEIVVLAVLHQRHDLTDLEYAFEKGEVMRRAT